MNVTKKSTDASTEVQRVTTATLTDEQRRLIERAEERLRGRGSEDAVAANGLLEVLIAHPARAAADGASAVIAELASMTRMFHAACHDLGLINEALGLDPDDGGAAPILAAIGELKTRTVSPVEQHEAAPADVTLPYENALHELIRKIMPDLDSGDILADAQTAISAVACRTMTDAQIDATWANLDARGSSLYEPHQWEVEMRRRFARAIIAATPAPAQTEPPAADERATLSLNPLQLRWIKDNVRDAYDTGYNDARRNSAVSGDSAPGYRGREIEKAKGDELAAALERAARASSPNAADERAAEAREDHECVYENGDGICRECAELAKRPKPFGYARAIDYRITGQEPEDHELCSADAPGAFAIYRASSPNAAGAPSGATPAGYVLVPIEPTPEMCLAMREAVGAGWEDSLVWAGGVAAAPQPPAPASAPDEEAFVVKRLSESLADVYTTLIGDDKVDVDDNLNAIQRVERAAQVLRLELELYRAQASAPVVLTDSARDVLAERRRQIEREGWTPARDDQYRDHELSCAAGCYAMYTLAYPAGDPPPAWPWAADWWKPTTHRRNLVKAGALILAEIERLDRSAARPQGSQS
ncbi:hypothetical protein [Burkholderia thailandensis]|uniref:Gp38 n=1 Tax=Burkholderia thailandensis TaxID=57975 RepID=A0AAW9CZW2_BURTH|nr:hypothetical protein DR62_4520 [Burkholderia thailandensis]AOI55522.1 hypothetical protein WI24_27720 [Burkholderia thailandensis]MDW9235606.1 hypothetical protein [Burkholderia thailandensis]MDW9253241.1 hypothetical protein [Burkholderia thailandensis]UCR75691.1 hypothetical protein BtTXDOH_42 [Burkholderia phage phiBt-TXDOH]